MPLSDTKLIWDIVVIDVTDVEVFKARQKRLCHLQYPTLRFKGAQMRSEAIIDLMKNDGLMHHNHLKASCC